MKKLAVIGLATLIASFLCLASTRAATFTVDPPATTNLVGDGFALMVLQDGSAPDPGLQFRWFKGVTNVVDDDIISGSESSILTFRNATLAQSGAYRASVSYTGAIQGWATSAVYVIAEPEIQNIFLTPNGAGVTFTAEATGGLLAYQWRWQGQDIIGATNSTLRFTDAYAQASAGYYSVVITNLLGVAASSPNAVLFTKIAPSGVYQGIFAMDDGVAPDSAGSFAFTVSSSARTYSGRFYSGGNIWRKSGTFALDHTFAITLPRTNGSDLVLDMQFITTNDAPQVVGTVSDGSSVGTVRGYRLYYSVARPTTLAGRYTLALVNTNWPILTGSASVLAPAGDGCATVLVQKSGLVAISGRVADATAFSQGWSLSRLGDLGVHAQMLGSRAQLLGMLKFANQAGGNIRGGPMTWMKVPNAADGYYPDGFYLNLQPAGSTYVPTNSPILSFTNGVATFYGGDLFDGESAIWNFARVYLKPPLKLIPELGPENLTLTINKINGVINGSFTDLATGRRAPLLGVVLQQQKCGRGFFLSTNSAGGLTLMPAVQ